MNERIEKLALQADNWAGTEFHRLFLNNINPNMKELFEEKFAELIVKECAQVSEDDITDGDACCTNTADRIARQIKKHFGVEE